MDGFVRFFTGLLQECIPSSSFPSSFSEGLLRSDPCDHADCVARLNLSCPCAYDKERIKSCCAGNATKRTGQGVPHYPLFQQLAAEICEYVLKGTTRLNPSFEFVEDVTKYFGWLEEVKRHGSAVHEAFGKTRYQLHVQDEFYRLIEGGLKTVEGRCATGVYTSIVSGDHIMFNATLLMQVEEVRMYKTFAEMLQDEGLSNVLPGCQSIAEGVQVYRRFYSEETERAGVLAIHIKKPSVEPSKHVSALLEAIGVEGVMFMLGLRHTKGSVVPSLPPPRCLLLASFLASNTENFPASKLTVGGRALSKHVHRSSSGWWGSFTGTEVMKNKAALEVVCRVIDNACWMNVHHLPQLLPVFETRVEEGYGARWLSDGTEFRGFLEPQMEDGHVNRWRH